MAKSSLYIIHNKQVRDLLTEAVKITYEDKLNDGCSRLNVTLLTPIQTIDNGDPVEFTYKGIPIFNGFIFQIQQQENGELSITAYDQLRYCKAKDSVPITAKDTASVMIKRMIQYLGLKAGTIADTKYTFSPMLEQDKVWLDVVYQYLSETFYYTGRYYVLRDEYGRLCLRDMEKLAMDLILGDDSLCYQYSYGKSIDDDFYNQVKVYAEIDPQESDSGTSGKQGKKQLTILMLRDTNSIKKYGTLQYFEDMSGSGSEINRSKMLQKAKIMLADYNRVHKTFQIDCLGIPEVRAGNVIRLEVKAVGAKENHVVRTVTHDFLPVHTMSMELVEVYESDTKKGKVEQSSITKYLDGEPSSYSSQTSANAAGQETATSTNIVTIARSYVGKVKYKFGAENVEGGLADCSSFTQYCYKKAGISIGRTTNEQVKAGVKIDKLNLRPGDLVLFKNTYNSGYLYGVSHVGIYAGGGEFIHCSSSAGVTVSSLNRAYYKSHYLMGRRVL